MHAYFTEDSWVLVLTLVVEDEVAPDPHAAPGEPGWVHARPGDIGQVQQAIAGGDAIVHFPATDTMYTLGPWEAVPLSPWLLGRHTVPQS